MRETTLENPNIVVKDSRIVDLDRIVKEVKQSEEWEAVGGAERRHSPPLDEEIFFAERCGRGAHEEILAE